MLFHEIALVFALQVRAPVYGEFKFTAGVFQYLHAFGVGETDKLAFHHFFKTAYEFRVIHLLEEFKVIAAVVESIADTVFDEILGQIHVVGDVVEGNFRFDHPEFREMSGGIGVFCAESGSECVDGAESRGSEFAFKLTGHGQCRRLSEEV